jgi:predicted phosphodiesterase
MMRIAIMADIHGNAVALDAVLDDIEQQGVVDEYWVLGDIAAPGPTPVEVLQRLSGLPNARCVRGNTDRYVCTGDRPPPSLEDAKTHPELLPVLVEVAGSFAWTQGIITYAGWFDWLSQLPLEITAVLPDGTRTLGVHVAPGRDDGLGFKHGLRDTELEDIIGDCDADLLFGGHHHVPLDITINGKHIVNVGSVSNPLLSDVRASYVLLEAKPSGYHLEHRRVEYNCETVIEEVLCLRHPGAGYIVKHLRGLGQP